MDPASLLAFCDARAGWLRETIAALVRLESPSIDKPAVDRCGDELAGRLQALGGRVSRLVQTQCGNHVRAEFAGGPRRVLIVGHFDTVWEVGRLARMPLREDRGRLYGPGVYDMKAGIAVAMLAVAALQQLRPAAAPTVVMLWTTDEEIGSGTSRGAIEEEARRSAAVLVLEPSLPGGGAKTSRKGCGDFELIVHGIPAHAGIEPGTGANAVHELARQIVAIQRLEDPRRGTSVNVCIVSGGSRTNVIPAEARAAIDVRVATRDDAVRIEEALRALRPQTDGTRLEIRGRIGRPPLERAPHVVRLYEEARRVAASLGRDLGEGGTGGASDGNFTAALGVPTLDGLGPEGEGAHADHEHVIVADLPWRAALLAALAVRAARPDGVE